MVCFYANVAHLARQNPTSFEEHTLQNGERTTAGPIHRLDLPGAGFAEAFQPEVSDSMGASHASANKGAFTRLVSCHVANFGKLHDQDFDFEPGLNVIEAANGVGKTTLANFVRARFYGFDDDAVQMGRQDLRERYRPWQGGAYGGEMVFEGQSGSYRVERAFAATSRDDFLAVYDLASGKRVRDLEDDLGFKVFGLDADSFERSTYVARLSGPHTRPTQRMLAKLTGTPTASQDVPSPAASDQVAARHADLCHRSREYADELARIEGLFGNDKPSNVPPDELIAALDKIDRAADQAQAQTQELQAVRDFMARSAQRFTTGLPSMDEIDAHQRLLTELTQVRAQQDVHGINLAEQERLNELQATFKDGLPAGEQLARCQELISRLNEIRGALQSQQLSDQDAQRLAMLQGYFKAGVPSDDDIRRCRGLLASAQATRGLDTAQLGAAEGASSVVAKVLAGAGAALLAVGLVIAVALYLPVPGIVVAIAGTCALIIALLLVVLGKSGASRRTDEAATEAELKAQGLELQAKAFTSTYAREVEPATAVDAIERLKTELTRLTERAERGRKRAEELEEEAAPLRGELDELLARYEISADDPQQGLMTLQANMETYERLTNARDVAASQAAERAARARELEGELVQFLAPYYDNASPANASALLSNLAGTVSAYQEAQRMLTAADSGQRTSAACKEEAQRNLEQVCARHGWPVAKVSRTFAENLAGAAARYPVVQAKLDAVRAQLRELVATYGPPPYGPATQADSEAVEKSFASYIERFSGIAASGVAVDETTGAVIRQQGRTHEIGELSQGYSDVIAFCMRMALGDALFEGAQPFIILDDPFVNLDDRHLSEALEFVKDLARDRQLIYLTCHSSRSM